MSVAASARLEVLLRAAMRLRQDADRRDALAAMLGDLADGSDDALLVAIEAEQVGPLLHWLIGADLAIVAPAVAGALRDTYHRTARRNLLLLSELAACLRALTAAEVPVIVLKGAALTETVYDNVALRPMGDVDVLVRASDLATTRRTLEALGYALAAMETHPGALADYENELTLRKPGHRDTLVDVHWSLFDSPYYQTRIAMDWFWDSARTASIAGVPSLVLGPEALTIHLCGHLALHHMATGLLWWHDIAAVLERYRDAMDWPVVLSRIDAYGLLPAVRPVLTRAVEEWGAPIPVDALRALRDRQHSREELHVYAQLASGQRPPGRRFWTDLTSTPGWRQRLRFARTNLFPSAAYMRERYDIQHPLLLPLYYPYRWLRGVRGLR
jgi:hypothetical protein